MLFFITSIQTKSLNYIKYPKAHQMATTHNELQQQYFALLNKHKKYLQVMEEFRQVNRVLTREVHNLEALDDVVYSADYQSKIDQALLNYEQYQALQREYDQVQKEEKIKPKELELAKVHNDKLRQKINQLNLEVRLTQKRESIFWEKQKLCTKFWQKYEANLEQSAQQISRLKSQHPLQQSMWLRLAKQRIRNMLQVERQQSGMKNEEELGFVQSERFYRLIARKTRQVEEQAIKMQAQLRALKENQITIQQFKIQNDLVSKTFGFESLSDQNDDKQELSIQEQRLQRQIMHVSEQISKQSQKTERLQVNLDIEARSGAINKTIDYLKHEKVEMQQNLGMIEEVLAAVDIGGDWVAKQQVKQIREEMKRIKYEMEMLQNEVKTTPVIVYSQ